MLNRMLLLAQAAGEGGDTKTPPDDGGTSDLVNQREDAFEGAMNGDFSGLIDILVKYGLPLLGGILILIATFIIGKMVAGIVRRSAEKSKIDLTLSRFFGKMVYYLILVIGVMIALGTVGIEVTSFAAVLAAVGFAIGMALSGTLGNFASGAMLLIFRPFKVGDVINVCGFIAKVNEIELFTTTFDTGDNRRIIVPNGKIYGDIIENITYHPERRLDIPVGCDYSADIDKTRETLAKACESLDEKLLKGEGRGYQIVLGDLGDSSVNWTVRFWCLASDYWPLKESLTRAIKMHLDEAGIGIPFPQMDVHLDKADA